MAGLNLQNSLQARWFPYVRRNTNAKVRLFCLPYAGGGASAFRTWADKLPDFIEIYPVQLPGREMRIRETPLTRMSSLVHALADAVDPLLNRPFAFFGHSMGAMICWELACELRRRHGIEPAQLFVSGRRAPQVPDNDPPLHDMQTSELLQALRRFSGIPEDFYEHAELVELKLPVLRADFELCEKYVYRPEPPLNCPITAFGGLEDLDESREMLERWGNRTSKVFKLRMLPGDHFFLHSSEALLLQLLFEELRQLTSPTAWNSLGG